MRVFLKIGDIFISRRPLVFETVLGSCVSVCIWDKESRAGGMNHYMFPYYFRGIKNPLFCGRESLYLLIKRLLDGGSSPHRLMAKVFGGCKAVRPSGDLGVGDENVKVAMDVLGEYGITVVKKCTGIDAGMKVLFYPVTGRAFVRQIRCP